LDPEQAGERIEERLEQILAPDARSISLKLTPGPSFHAKKQKFVVRDTLSMFVSLFIFFLLSHEPSIFRYNLLAYTTVNESNRKETKVEVPEEKFADWLTQYRAKVAKRDSENGNEADDGTWSRVNYN
jgi:hypothetical protein